MMRFLRQIKRKRNVRRLLAAGFLFVAIVELGSHAFMDSHDPNFESDLTVCRVSDNPSPLADCPDKRQQRQETKNLLDEMTSHSGLLAELSLPLKGVLYDTAINFSYDHRPITRSLTPPFQPPKQA
ncbi:MAG TPA: hypothetical protein VGO43_01365 [Pyrinomonadaceae bacterium]|nr:hypothetical protein [Pyrinomonadaceae bacterium]